MKIEKDQNFVILATKESCLETKKKNKQEQINVLNSNPKKR